MADTRHTSCLNALTHDPQPVVILVRMFTSSCNSALNTPDNVLRVSYPCLLPTPCIPYQYTHGDNSCVNTPSKCLIPSRPQPPRVSHP
jgi:hypothetical protein